MSDSEDSGGTSSDGEFSSDGVGSTRTRDDYTITFDTSGNNFGDTSQQEGEEHTASSPSSSHESEGEQVMVAVPPKDSEGGSDYHEIALSGSAALDLLDQLAANNAIGKEKAAKLRRKYNSLRETLETSRQVESNLLDNVKSLGHRLAYQKRVLEKAATFPEGNTTQVGNLRQIYLTHQNELSMCEARMEKLQRQIALLEEDHKVVEKEYNRQPKKEEIDQHIKELKKVTDELNDEISLRSQDAKSCHAELDKKNFRVAVTKQETDELLQLQDVLQVELINIRNGPNPSKELEAVKREYKDTVQRIKEQDSFLKDLTAQVEEAEQRNEAVKQECSELATALHAQREAVVEKEVGSEQLRKHLAMGKEREASLLEDRANLEIRDKHRLTEARALHEAITGKTKEKDRELKALKKAELQRASLQQSIEQVKRHVIPLEEDKAKQTAMLERIAQSKQEVRLEVESLRKGLKQMAGLTEEGQAMLNQKLAVEEKYRARVRELQGKLYELDKDIIIMTKARDKESRLYYQTLKEQRTIEGQHQTKEMQISEQNKRIKELEAELKDFNAAYDIVKNERNRTHSQIVLLQQLSAELVEKSKILENEIDILHNSSAEKEKILQKCASVHTTKTMEREAQRQDLRLLKNNQFEINQDLESQREAIFKLTRQIDATEQQLNRLRKHYEQAVQERNDLGLQLIERNEEVCVFYEKLNVQETVAREGNLKLAGKEEELKFLKLELRRLQNEMFILHKKLPDKENTAAELDSSKFELKACEQQVRLLETAVEDASDPDRLRLLPGKNPTRSELNEKLDKVESQLAECERELLEKELLCEQIGKLTDRAKKKVEGQRSSTLAVAKKVNHYQSKIKDLTRKMMALVSELSMEQASSLRLQQEVKEQESKLQQAYTRLENGEAPDDDTGIHWEKLLQIKNRKWKDEMEKKAMEEENTRLLPGGVMTTAEPRPNAYMPSSEGSLPVPKPYGSHAPFRPSQPGANIRHIRKPQPQPIDI